MDPGDDMTMKRFAGVRAWCVAALLLAALTVGDPGLAAAATAAPGAGADAVAAMVPPLTLTPIAAPPAPSDGEDGGAASGPTTAPAGSTLVVVPTSAAPTGPTKERFFGAGARARFVAVPNFVLGIAGLQDNLGTFQEGFGFDVGYRSMTLMDGRPQGGFDLGLSFFWDDYRFTKKRGVACSEFAAGGTRASSDPLTCDTYFPDVRDPGSVRGGFFREDGDPPLETEFRLQNLRMMGVELVINGWWALNPFFHLDLGASVGGGAVLGKMIYFDTFATQPGQAIDQRTPCATEGVKPAGGLEGTGCQEANVEESSVPPALPILRLWLGATFSITKNVEITLRGGVGAPSIFHADAGVYFWF
ncbi:MAG TPA: hypothetical protein VG389_15270 [Myxococcota bacterium]|jgi:hypothetical protein|nr:hypothetical protein [Myxococcota bacterium]